MQFALQPAILFFVFHTCVSFCVFGAPCLRYAVWHLVSRYLVVSCIFLSFNLVSCVINATLVCIILVRIKRALSKACHLKLIWFFFGAPPHYANPFKRLSKCCKWLLQCNQNMRTDGDEFRWQPILLYLWYVVVKVIRTVAKVTQSHLTKKRVSHTHIPNLHKYNAY